MRFLMDYLIPLAIIGLGYVGIQKVLTRANWSFFSRFVLHLFAAIFLTVMILYEYFVERPIIGSLREATGNALCRRFVMERCPDFIKIELADEEAARYHHEAVNLRKQNKRAEAEEHTKKANEADQRAQTLRQQANETRRLVAATTVVRDVLGPGARIYKSGIMDNLALVSWTQNPMGGEALLKFETNKREWVIIELGGGAWGVDSLAEAGGISREKAKLFLSKITNEQGSGQPQKRLLARGQ